MTQFVIHWCKMMFTQSGSAVRVKTGSCQEGALSAQGILPKEKPEIISSISLFDNTPFVEVEENTIYLNRRETSFVNREVQRLLKAKLHETQRKKKAGIPLPPEPGKIVYAVYQ